MSGPWLLFRSSTMSRAQSAFLRADEPALTPAHRSVLREDRGRQRLRWGSMRKIFDSSQIRFSAVAY